MVTARILERYEMELPEPVEGEPYFLDWVLRSPKQAGIHLTAGWHALHAAWVNVPNQPTSCMEYFGGIGAQALISQELFEFEDHTVFDFSKPAADHLLRALPDIWTGQRDAYDPATTQSADVVLLDFGDLTVWKTREGEAHRGLLDRVFDLGPEAVVITDVAARYLHLHRERYESLLGAGTCGSYVDYLEAFSRRLEGLFGYTLAAGFHHTWSTVMTFVPAGTVAHGHFIPTPSVPRGLELLP